MAEEPKADRKLHLGHRIMQRVLALLCKLVFLIYGRWKIIGRENIPRTGPVLFAANHASYLDPLLGWAAVYGTRRMWGIARSELWHPPVLAFLMDSINSIPVRRNTADRAMMRRTLELLAQGETVGLFPEGTRTFDGLLNPAQPGIALLVQKSGAPVVPVALLGTYEMLPRHRKKLRRVPLKIVFGKPMLFAASASREEITTRIMQEVALLMTANGVPTEPPGPERAALLQTNENKENESKEARYRNVPG